MALPSHGDYAFAMYKHSLNSICVFFVTMGNTIKRSVQIKVVEPRPQAEIVQVLINIKIIIAINVNDHGESVSQRFYKVI